MSWFSNLFTFGKKKKLDPLVDAGNSMHIEEVDHYEAFGDTNEENLFISIGSTSLKVLSISEMKDEKTKLLWSENISYGPLLGKHDGEAVQNIYEAVEKSLETIKDKIFDKKNIKVSLPSQGVFFRNITIPKIDNSDKLLIAELKKAIPIPFEEVLFANNVVWEKNNKENHMCIIMQKEFIKKFEDVFTKFNLKPEFELEVFSLARVVSKEANIKCVVHIGAEMTLLIFIQNGVVVSVHTIENGSININFEIKMKTEVNFEQAEKLKVNFKKISEQKMDSAGVVQDFLLDFSKKISHDISNDVLSFEKETEAAVSEINLCGGGSNIPNLKENISEIFGKAMAVKVLNYQNVIVHKNAIHLQEENVGRYAQCIGLILKEM